MHLNTQEQGFDRRVFEDSMAMISTIMMFAMKAQAQAQAQAPEQEQEQVLAQAQALASTLFAYCRDLDRKFLEPQCSYRLEPRLLLPSTRIFTQIFFEPEWETLWESIFCRRFGASVACICYTFTSPLDKLQL
jgi:hypothetical protein